MDLRSFGLAPDNLMRELMHDLWDVKGLTAVAINMVLACVAWTWRTSQTMFGSVASDFVAKELLPWVTLAGVFTTSILALLNYIDKRRERRERKAQRTEPTDSP